MFSKELVDKIGSLKKGDDVTIELPKDVTSELDKNGRKNVHVWIRSVFEEKVVSSVDDGVFRVKYKDFKKTLDARDRNDRRSKRDSKLVLRFVLAKSNIDTAFINDIKIVWFRYSWLSHVT